MPTTLGSQISRPTTEGTKVNISRMLIMTRYNKARDSSQVREAWDMHIYIE